MVAAVDSTIHANDGMYQTMQARHYLATGLSAIRCIEAGIDDASEVRHILDMPCGYGRALRFLKLRFPKADITACEIEREALDFCGSHFDVATILSQNDIRNLRTAMEFDLIWCGSLLTHLTETAASEVLRFFYERLTPDGLCVFTTQGETSARWIESGLESYGLPKQKLDDLLRDYRHSGRGYSDYNGQSSYGISLLSRKAVSEIAATAGEWHEVVFMEHGWDNHQDVYGFSKQQRPVNVITHPLPKKKAGRWRPAF